MCHGDFSFFLGDFNREHPPKGKKGAPASISDRQETCSVWFGSGPQAAAGPSSQSFDRWLLSVHRSGFLRTCRCADWHT